VWIFTREDIIRDANDSDGFPILTNNTTDIAGTKRTSVGVLFTEIKSAHTCCLTEEFLGFVDFRDFVDTVFCCGKL